MGQRMLSEGSGSERRSAMRGECEAESVSTWEIDARFPSFTGPTHGSDGVTDRRGGTQTGQDSCWPALLEILHAAEDLDGRVLKDLPPAQGGTGLTTLDEIPQTTSIDRLDSHQTRSCRARLPSYS